jgi:hypothetical protein
MLDLGNARDPLLAVVEALKECTGTMQRLASFMDGAGRAPIVPARGPRTGDRPLPAGMTAWVSAEDVVNAVGCSRSKANEYLRAAAGRSVGTGRLLRVPVDVWEAWARDMLIDGFGRRGRREGRTSRHINPPPSGNSETPMARSPPRRRILGPWPRAESKLALIPLLAPRKR